MNPRRWIASRYAVGSVEGSWISLPLEGLICIAQFIARHLLLWECLGKCLRHVIRNPRCLCSSGRRQLRREKKAKVAVIHINDIISARHNKKKRKNKGALYGRGRRRKWFIKALPRNWKEKENERSDAKQDEEKDEDETQNERKQRFLQTKYWA